MTNSNPNVITGSKHDSRRDLRDTAKLIRADLKAAAKAGRLPAGFRASVKISRYSMGQSINIAITAVGELAVMNPERVAFEAATPFSHCELYRHTDAARAVLATVEGIAAEYNHRRTDCKHMHFYPSIDFTGEVETASRDAVLADLRAIEAIDHMVSSLRSAPRPVLRPVRHVLADCVEVPE